ncbi:hypothetical protein AAVH_11661 [Aphelenchoides avenae]|nr:hypothetical protein AAVH_11661 [Aphelenchus avenae]
MAPKAGTRKNKTERAPEKTAFGNEAEEADSTKTQENANPMAEASEAPKGVASKISLPRTAKKVQPKKEVEVEKEGKKSAIGAQGKAAAASEVPKEGLAKPSSKRVGKKAGQKEEVEVVDLEQEADDDEEAAPGAKPKGAANDAEENTLESATTASEAPKVELTKPSRKRSAKKTEKSEEAEAIDLHQDLEEPKAKQPAPKATKGNKKEALLAKENASSNVKSFLISMPTVVMIFCFQKADTPVIATPEGPKPPAPKADVEKAERLHQLKTKFQDLEREFAAFAKSQQKQMKDIHNLMMALSGK